MPGGGVEYEESLTEAVEREVLEETGYLVEVGPPIAAHTFTIPDGGRDGRPYKSLRVVFSAVIIGGKLGTTGVGGPTDFAQWVPLGEVEHPRGLLGARAMLIAIVVPAGMLAGLGISAWGPTRDTNTGELVRPDAHLLLGGVKWGFTAIIAVVGVVAMFAQRRS